jgi:hypothetical protein
METIVEPQIAHVVRPGVLARRRGGRIADDGEDRDEVVRGAAGLSCARTLEAA